jgi:hypothetical protein
MWAVGDRSKKLSTEIAVSVHKVVHIYGNFAPETKPETLFQVLAYGNNKGASVN